MNIAKLKDETQHDDTPAEVEIKDRHGEPYVGKDGQPTVFLIVGEYSKQYRKAERKTTDAVVKAARRGMDFDAEDSQKFRLERLAGAIVGWRNVEAEDGAPVPFTNENAVQVLQAAPWIALQVERALQAHASFFANGSPS